MGDALPRRAHQTAVWFVQHTQKLLTKKSPWTYKVSLLGWTHILVCPVAPMPGFMKKTTTALSECATS